MLRISISRSPLMATVLTLMHAASAACLLAFTLPVSAGLAYLTRDSSLLRLAVCVVPMAGLGALVAARFCVPAGLGGELVARAPSRFRRPVARLFGHKPG